ncbi:MAG TPA: hypothetical protein VLY24_28050 [Bryobacteraceae bacterium]|nr:hypothetical protein [Bryobacteraceae bacterium]
MKLVAASSYLFCALAMAFLARLELHTDDAGIEVFCILLSTLVLGCWHPSRAWQWALLIGLTVPAASWIWRTPRPTLDFTVPAFVIAVGLVGSYAGVFLRRLISARSAT